MSRPNVAFNMSRPDVAFINYSEREYFKKDMERCPDRVKAWLKANGYKMSENESCVKKLEIEIKLQNVEERSKKATIYVWYNTDKDIVEAYPIP